MLEIGQPAPVFTLQSHTQEGVSLTQYKGKKNVILSFHIFSFTGGWTHQVSSFRQEQSSFEERDTQVLGISTDAVATQTAFSTSLGNIPYPILSDFHPKGEIAEAYGVYNRERGTANRAIFIIDKQGLIQFQRVYSNMSEFNMDSILNEVDKL